VRAVCGWASRPDPGPGAAADPEAVLAALTRSSGKWPWPPRGRCACWPGPETGKTRAVAHRIAYAALTGVVDPAHVLA